MDPAGVAGVGVALVLGGLGLVRSLITDRVISQWRRDENTQVELLKSELASRQSMLESAVHNHTAGQELLQKERFEATRRLWRGAMEIRSGLGFPVLFFSLLVPEEYDAAVLGDGGGSDLAGLITTEYVNDAMKPLEAVELDRPLLGEKLWLRFFIYRAFLGRLGAIVLLGRKQGHLEDWRLDTGIRQLLPFALPRETVDRLLDTTQPLGNPNDVASSIEAVMLQDIDEIISGRVSATESLDNTLRINENINRVQLELEKSDKKGTIRAAVR